MLAHTKTELPSSPSNCVVSSRVILRAVEIDFHQTILIIMLSILHASIGERIAIKHSVICVYLEHRHRLE